MNKDRDPVRLDVRAVVWGTYDTGKPRVRILLEAITHCFTEVHQCHWDIWRGVEDKTQIKSRLRVLIIFARWLFAYPVLLIRYFRLPKHDYLFVPYMGVIDLLIIYPFARMRGATICLDIFISVYDTTVIDRGLLKKSGLAAKLLFFIEKKAIKLADRRLSDTRTHANYIASLFGLKRREVDTLFVGVEGDKFPRLDRSPHIEGESKPLKILFYGQFIPLHGIDVIVSAAAIVEKQYGEAFSWKIIGSGQLDAEIDRQIAAQALTSVERVCWITYENLAAEIQKADICLGVFNQEGKSQRVIPNKVYQILAVGRPLITADSPAIRELVEPGEGISLVQPGSPEALAKAVLELSVLLSERTWNSEKMPRITVENVAQQLLAIL